MSIMQMIEDTYVDSKKPRGSVNLELAGSDAQVDITEIKLNAGDFSVALLATTPDKVDELLGYSGFITQQHHSSLMRAEPSFMELRMLKVDPKYFGTGVGRALLDHSKQFAIEIQKTLILEPKNPKQRGKEDHADDEYPRSTAQLRQMYLRSGFREFTVEEVDRYAQRIDDADFTFRLWCEGIDPETCEFTHDRRYSMSLEERATLDHVPFETKLRLYTEVLKTSGAMKDAVERHRKIHRDLVESHLVVESTQR